jgi:hypothetical protein
MFNIGPPSLTEIVQNVEIKGNGEIVNFGKVPAVIDYSGVKLEVRKGWVPENFVYPPIPQGKLVLYPTETGAKTNDDTIKISDTDFKAILGKKKRLVLHGIILYHDTFGSYTTKWCFYWVHDARLFSACKGYNEAK